MVKQTVTKNTRTLKERDKAKGKAVRKMKKK